MTTTAERVRGGAVQETMNALGLALRAPVSDLLLHLERSEGERAFAARHLHVHGDRESLAVLRLRESVAWYRLGRMEQSFHSSREAFSLLDGRAAPSVCALVLTQVAAASAGRGDGSAAVRNARRAEALVVSSGGEATPQALAVRAQLVALLSARGETPAIAIQRRDASLKALALLAKDDLARARVRRLDDVFRKDTAPPHWALCYCMGWRNVHP